MNSSAADFNARQRARLATAFAEIQRRLLEATHALERDTHARLSTVIPDATPLQRRLMADYAGRCRDVMMALADRYHIEFAPPRTGALRRARDALDLGVIAAAELGPRYFCAEGPLTDDLEAELNRIISQLLDHLDAMRRIVAAPTAMESETMTGRSDRIWPDAALLEEIARIAKSYSLSELRPPIDALMERLRRDDFEIAAFGRVNAGKSSLINTFLGRAILPVGMTPATAVDVHVVYGSEPWCFATFADAAPEKFVLGRLPEFAAEHFNPSNARHVTRLRVEMPESKLANGITLVDTPGIALDGHGAGALLAEFVPRCDIGLVLIDAAAGLGLDEAALVSALQRAGSVPLVVLTKAERLPAEERWAVHGMLERGLSAMTGFAVPVYFASTTSPDPSLRNDWIDRGLEPLLDARKTLRARSLRRKLACVRDAAIAALERRLLLARDGSSTVGARRHADRAVAEARALLRDGPAFNPDGESRRQTAALIVEVAHNATVLWSQGNERSIDVTTLVAASLQARASAVASAAERDLAKAYARCRLALSSLGALAGVAGGEAADIESPEAAPLFDGASAISTMMLPRSRLAFLGARWRRRAAWEWLNASSLPARTMSALAPYVALVHEWRLQALATMNQTFEGKRQQLETLRACRASTADSDVLIHAMTLDLERLRRMRQSPSDEISGKMDRSHAVGAGVAPKS